jgi:hypothetical protein
MNYRSVLILPIASLLLTACQEQDEKYFPLQAGKSWQYQIVTQDMDLEKKYKRYVVNKGLEKVNDQNVYTREINDGILVYFEKKAEGIRQAGLKKKLDINTQYQQEDHYVLGYPLEVGTQWQQESITGVLEVVIAPFRRHYVLHAPVTMQYSITSLEEKISVPAGRFTDCIKVEGEGKARAKADKSLGNLKIKVKSSDWYCPEVGLAKSERLESTDSPVLVQGSFLMELEKFTTN